MAHAAARQHERRADIGMARKRHLAPRREYSYFGGMCRVLWGANKGRLGEVEFGGDGLHLARRQFPGVEDHG
jgi:hypothetical protein